MFISIFKVSNFRFRFKYSLYINTKNFDFVIIIINSYFLPVQ